MNGAVKLQNNGELETVSSFNPKEEFEKRRWVLITNVPDGVDLEVSYRDCLPCEQNLRIRSWKLLEQALKQRSQQPYIYANTVTICYLHHKLTVLLNSFYVMYFSLGSSWKLLVMILTIEPVFTVWAKREFLKVLFRSCTLQWLDEGGGGGGGGVIAFFMRILRWASFSYALTKGWATDNNFIIDFFPVCLPPPSCTLWPVPKRYLNQRERW